MARKPAAPAIETIDPEALYTIHLVQVVQAGRITLVPGSTRELRGDLLARVLEETPGAIKSYALR